MRSNASTMVKTYSCGYPRDLGHPSVCYETAVCFNYKYSDGESDGRTCGGCSVVLVVLVSLIMEAIAE